MKRVYLPLNLALCIGLVALLSACNPENMMARRLEGSWDITSYLLEGREEIGNTYSSIEFRFEAYNGEFGNFQFTSIDFQNNAIIEKGNYEILGEEEVEFFLEGGPVLQYGITVEQDRLELRQKLGGEKVVFIGKKK